jgi:hypothetical protein
LPLGAAYWGWPYRTIFELKKKGLEVVSKPFLSVTYFDSFIYQRRSFVHS